MAGTRTIRVAVEGDRRVRAEIRQPAGFQPGVTPALVLAHGAGNDMTAPLIAGLVRELGREYATVRFNFLYTEEGRRSPDPAPRLEAAYRAVLARVRDEVATGVLFAGGKSMGGRMASHLAAAGEELAGLVFLGYPLHPPGRSERLRDQHLPRIRCPMLFIQGTRDRLCDLDLLRGVLRRLRAPHRLHVVMDGDHSFRVPKRAGRSEESIREEIRAVIAGWIVDVAASARRR